VIVLNFSHEKLLMMNGCLVIFTFTFIFVFILLRIRVVDEDIASQLCYNRKKRFA
jgi:hypothetical protein